MLRPICSWHRSPGPASCERSGIANNYSQVPVFVQFNGYPPHVDARFQGRIRLVEQASIEISELRESDEGWYECSVVFLDGPTEETPANVSSIYLSVNG